MRRVALLFILLFVAVGCSPENGKAAGMWPGLFRPGLVGGEPPAATDVFKGFVQLYAGGMKFKMEMRSTNEAFKIEGSWRIQGQRVFLTAKTFSFELPTEEDQKALAMHIVGASDVKTAFSRELVLDMNSARTELSGLPISLGNWSGRFVFNRVLPT